MNIYPVSPTLLSEFIQQFYGYGNLDSPYWFIGKEEGGGVDLVENFNRIRTWESFGKPATVDTIDYHLALGFNEKQLTKIQPTWTKLIQILSVLEGGDPMDKEARRRYQRHHLGRLQGNNCCLELMPLASRSTGLWLWQQIASEYLQIHNRKEYFENIAPLRQNMLRSLIERHQPKLVVFYSSQTDYIPFWHHIAQTDTWQWHQVSPKCTCAWTKSQGTLYVITTHPTYKGITNQDFATIGNLIKEKL